MKTIEVEFTGVARSLAGEKKIQLVLDDQASYRDIVRELAHHYPAFVGVLIASDERAFLSANLFSRADGEPIMPDTMDALPQDGERLVVLYFIVGG
jgi:hypothetical protein